MSPALRALIDADHQRPGPSDGVRTGVYAALGVSLGVLPAGAIAAAEAATATATTTTATAGTTAAAATPAAAAASTVVGATKVVGPLAFLAQAPLIGVGVGAVLGAALTAYVVKGPKAPSPRVEPAPAAQVVAAAPPPAVEPAPTPEPAPAVSPEPAPAVSPRAPRPAAPVARRIAATPAPSVDDRPARAEEARKVATSGALAAEQSLLDPARAALAGGDGATALARLALHERRFPAGLLSQEREAMAIRALVLTGARADAERRAAAFRSRYPGSLLGPTIDATLRARP
jgi:hypothetical protein